MKHILLTMLAMLAAQAGAGQLRTDIQHDTPPGQATMKVYDGDKLLFQAASQGLSCISESKFSSDGKWLLNIASGCGYVQLWDVKKGERVKTFLGDWKIWGADFTPDSKRLLLSFSDSGEKINLKRPRYLPAPTLWDLDSLKITAFLYNDKHESYFERKVSFSRDGMSMIFASSGGYGQYGPASIWNAKTGAYISTIPRLPYSEKDRGGAGSQDARLSPDGRRVLVLYADGRLAEYEVKTAKLLKVRGKPTDYQKQLDHFAQTGQ